MGTVSRSDNLFWADNDHGNQATFYKDEALDIAIDKLGFNVDAFDDMSDEEVEECVRYICENR